jgi:RNA polymerase sigma factor (sigma-70 family)
MSVNIEDYVPYVRNFMIRYFKKNNRHLDDLVSCGYLALVRAADKFDPSRDIKFKTYLDHILRGAALDYFKTLVNENSKYDCRRASEVQLSVLEPDQEPESNDTECLVELLKYRVEEKLSIFSIKKRNAMLDKYFSSHASPQEIAKRHSITKSRLHQITQETGIVKLIRKAIDEIT